MNLCRGGVRLLKFLTMCVTGRCNLDCRYCYAADESAVDMSFETAKAAIDNLFAEDEGFTLQITGGEPLLNLPLLRQIADYIAEKKLSARLQIQTNATLIDEAALHFIKKYHPAIGISLDGRPSVNERNGRGGKALAFEGAMRLAHSNIGVGLTCVVTNENASELSGIVETAYYFGNVKKIGFDILRNCGRGKELLLPSGEAMREGLEKAFKKADELISLTGRKIIFSQVKQAKALSARETGGFSHCHALNGTGAHLSPDGKIWACPSLYGIDDFFLGDVRSGKDEERQRKIASRMREYMSFCEECEDFLSCGGACFARIYGAGKALPNDAECALKRAAIKRSRSS